MILLDTHALLWWTLDDRNLSKKGKALLQKSSTENVYINSISFWEIFIKVKKEKLHLGIAVDEYARRVVRSGNVTVIDSDWEIYHLASDLKWQHKDPVDRILVATSVIKKVSLLSKDDEIRKFHKKTVW